MPDVDVVVIGAGGMGAATARAVARRGRDVLLLERFEVGHSRGSSHGASRIFRFSYHHPMYVRMAMEALSLWRDLEEESVRSILTVTGGLDVGPTLPLHVEALEACGVRYELLDGREVGRRFALTFPPEASVLYQADSGVLAADVAVRALINSALSNGAELREGTPVTGVGEIGGGVEIRVGSEGITARTAVVTAGAWGRGLLAGAGVDLPVWPTRETVVYFRLEGDGEPASPTVVEWTHPPVYALSSAGQEVKCGHHRAGPSVDPDEPGEADLDSVQELTRWIGERYPAADPTPLRSETCLYTNTADESFVLERHGRIVVGSPCSGHGFKFAPLIGERLADLAEERTGVAAP